MRLIETQNGGSANNHVVQHLSEEFLGMYKELQNENNRLKEDIQNLKIELAVLRKEIELKKKL